MPESKEVIYKEIEKNDIEIIIMDIDIFGISTLNTIQKVNKKYQDVMFIFYGNIVDKEYIDKLAMINCINILYKPLKDVEVKKALENAVKYFKIKEKEIKYKTKLEERCGEEKERYKDKFIMNLINNKINSEDEIKRSIEFYDLDIKENYRSLIIKVDNYQKIILTLDEFEKQVLNMKIYDMVKFVLGDRKKVVSSTNFNEIVVLLDSDEEMEDILELCEEIKEEIYKLDKTRVTIGVGRNYKDAKDMHISYREALSSLRYRFYLGHNKTIPIDYVEPMNLITYRYPIEKEEKLIYATVIGEFTYSSKLINEICESLEKLEEVKREVLQKIVMNIIISINRYATEKGLETSRIYKDFFDINRILEIETLEQFKEYLLNSIRKYCECVIKIYNETDIRIHDEVIKYVEQYYYETVDLDKIAKIVGTSKEYVNKVFIDRSKVNLNEYIESYRLTEAKKMMKETKFDDDFVAIKNGFENKKQLRKIFKDKVGVTTEEFRKTK